MNYTETVGWVAFGVTVIFASVGIFAQIVKNFKAKSTKGLSAFTFSMQFLCFALWSVYGYLKPDYYVLGANLPGSFFVAIIIWQFFKYRKAG